MDNINEFVYQGEKYEAAPEVDDEEDGCFGCDFNNKGMGAACEKQNSSGPGCRVGKRKDGRSIIWVRAD